MILQGFSLPDNFQALEKFGNAKLSLSGPCTLWSYVHLYGGTLEVDSAINDGGVITNSAIQTGAGNGGTNFIGVPAGTPLEVGMSVLHGRLPTGTTILSIVDINADPVVAEISSNSDGTNRTESGSIGMAGAIGIINTSAANFRWVNSATLKYDGPTNSTNRAFTIDNGDTATWEIIAGSNLTVSGGTAATSGKLTKTGDGTLTLSGTQAYTGATAVDAGTLGLVGGSQASPITVASGASLGFTLGSTTSSTSSVDLTNGTVKITGAVDNASDYQLMTASSFTFTDPLTQLAPTITDYELQVLNSGTELWLVYTGVAGTPFDTWAGTGTLGPVTFDGDTNADGVQDGIAFLLGVANPDDNANGNLPTESESGGALILTFNCLPSGDRGTAELRVSHSNSLGSWTATVDEVPDADDAVPDNDVTFVVDTVSEAPLNKVTATIGSAAAAGGKLFGRLEAIEEPVILVE
jgi:autotransporter-associated beta strand protein